MNKFRAGMVTVAATLAMSGAAYAACGNPGPGKPSVAPPPRVCVHGGHPLRCVVHVIIKHL